MKRQDNGDRMDKQSSFGSQKNEVENLIRLKTLARNPFQKFSLFLVGGKKVVTWPKQLLIDHAAEKRDQDPGTQI